MRKARMKKKRRTKEGGAETEKKKRKEKKRGAEAERRR